MLLDYRRAYGDDGDASAAVDAAAADAVVHFSLKLTESELRSFLARLAEWRDTKAPGGEDGDDAFFDIYPPPARPSPPALAPLLAHVSPSTPPSARRRAAPTTGTRRSQTPTFRASSSTPRAAREQPSARAARGAPRSRARGGGGR